MRLPFERNLLDTTSSGWHAVVPPGTNTASPYVRGRVGRFAISFGEWVCVGVGVCVCVCVCVGGWVGGWVGGCG
jgi:hypothetical protein